MKDLMRREPLIPFVLIGALIYVAWSALKPEDVEFVRIESAALRALETSQFELRGRPLDEEERRELWAGYVDDEVLLHEALRRGLQWSDFRVRKRLVQIMRGSLAEIVPEPSMAQLQAQFSANPKRYANPPSTTFEFVAFRWGDETTEGQIAATLKRLRSGEKMETSRWKRVSRVGIVTSHGPKIADAMEALPVGEWSGPIESSRGRYLIRVIERHPEKPATFEEVESYLRQEWLMTRTRELQQKRIDDIRATYRIELVRE